MDIRRVVKQTPVLGAVGAYFWTFYESHKIRQHQIERHYIEHATEEEKIEILHSFSRFCGCKVFVETGTYLGKTVGAMADVFDVCYSIELSRELVDAAQVRLAEKPNVQLICGDSGVKLREILASINEPSLFWLDAHYSQGVTARSIRDTPIGSELDAIFSHHIKDHIVLVDDARCFLGLRGYPSIRELQRYVKKQAPYYTFTVFSDIIRIYRGDYTG
jgi:hypothetical protein